jgi:tetratricopeptide (TPR) repeat protein
MLRFFSFVGFVAFSTFVPSASGAKPTEQLTEKSTVILPTSPDQVLERLPPRVKSQNSVIVTSASKQNQWSHSANNHSGNLPANQNIQNILSTTAQLIDLARTTGDPRYLGRAQSALSVFWDSSRAPIRAIVFQATIEQSRHEFDAARRSLRRAIALGNTQTPRLSTDSYEQQSAQLAQAWLTLATIERVAGNYAEALKACNQVIALEVLFYGNACLLETQSHVGEHTTAISGLLTLIAQLARQPNVQSATTANRSWLWSLIGEAYERSGSDALAAKAYDTSIAIQSDIYTVIAAADLALRQTRSLGANANKALGLISKVNETDALLIRKAYALKRLNNSQWQPIAAALAQRFDQIQVRGDDRKAHAREQALIALWLNDNFSESLQFSLVNLERQRETIDWLVALQAANKQNNLTIKIELLNRLKKTKLNDARLQFANV